MVSYTHSYIFVQYDWSKTNGMSQFPNFAMLQDGTHSSQMNQTLEVNHDWT